MPMYNVIEYSSNYWETIGSLLFYSKDEATNFNSDIANDNNFKSFEYKGKLLQNTVAQDAPNQANGIIKKCNNCCAIKILERSACWNWYKTRSEKESTTNDHRYFLKSNFVKVNILFVLVYSDQDVRCLSNKYANYKYTIKQIKTYSKK